MITYHIEGVEKFGLYRRVLTLWIRRVAAKYGKRTGNITYLFVDDERILETNRQFLGHDYYTDVITFADNEGKIINGDIMISVDTVRSNAEELGVSFEDELNRVMIHGILHLCGLNDKTPEEEQVMREAEDEALNMRLRY